MDHPWAGIVLDESSILKAFDGKTREALIRVGAAVSRSALCCTATPSPNDYVELGGHSAFLGVLNRTSRCSRSSSSTTGSDAAQLAAEGPRRDAFWRWVATWARALRAPADLGYDDEGFELPPFDGRDDLRRRGHA